MRILALALGLCLSGLLLEEAKAQAVTIEITVTAGRSEPELVPLLRNELPREIQKAVAGKYNGPLRVRITDAKLLREPGFGIATRADYLEGVLTVPGRDPVPIRLTLPFERSLFMFSPQGEAVRVQNLIEVFAQWVAKYI
jgi:hypothetical protein